MKTSNSRILSTNEIQKIVQNANMDYESVVNKALNQYLSKIFLSCPFTDELCLQKTQCIGCESYDLTIK
jgi:hypothetical protein